MLKSIKVSFKETIIYGLGNIAVKVVGLILIPLYTDPKFFSLDDFGVLGILEITGLVITAVMASALPQSLIRWYWDKDYHDKQKGIFFMTFATQLSVSVLFCILLIPLSGSLSILLFSNTDWSKVIVMLIIASATQSVNNVINALMRLQSKSMLYSLTNLIKLVIVLSLTLSFIIKGGMGLRGIYLAQVIGNLATLLILAWYAIKNSEIYFNFRVLRAMSSYGFPLLLANISAVALNVIDRYSLNSLALMKFVAIYTMAYKITSVLKLVLVDSIKLAVGPMMLKRMDAPDNKRFYSKVLLYTSYVMMFAVVGVSLFSYEVIKVLSGTKELWSAFTIIPILSLSIFFVNMKEITVYGLHIAKKTGIIGIIVVIASVLSLVLNILLIPQWDITGAAIATLVTQFVYWFACHFFSQRSFHVPYEIRKIATLLVVGMLLSFSCFIFNSYDLWARLILKTACLISFPFILYPFGFYEPVELQAIKGFFSKWSDLKNLRNNLNSLKGLNDEEL
jgi:O-antigen/teichoic acid export membrane protein